MGKELFALGFSIIVIVGFFSGCQESQSEAASFEGVTLESSVVELVNASLKYYYDEYNDVEKVEVQYRFHNIARRDIVLDVTVECYDENDNLITILGHKSISLPDDYTEQAILPGVNIQSYDGENAYMIDHVTIVAVEKEWTFQDSILFKMEIGDYFLYFLIVTYKAIITNIIAASNPGVLSLPLASLYARIIEVSPLLFAFLSIVVSVG